jgi:hypothetical protein
MHSHLYAQTGQFATPKEMSILMIIVVLLIVGGIGRKVFG